MNKFRANYDVIYRFFTTSRIPQVNIISTRTIYTQASARTRTGLTTTGKGGEFRSNKGVLLIKLNESVGSMNSITRKRWRIQQGFDNFKILSLTRSYTTSTSKCSDPDCPHEPLGNNSGSNAFTPNPPPSLSSLPPPPKLTSLPAPSSLSKIQLPHPTYLNSLPLSIRRLAVALPSPAGKPPSRDQLLSLTNSFFDRLQIYFKWFTIRSYRRFRLDDYSAFASVGIMGTLGWFVISTTSFMAFCFFIVNSLSLQEWLAGKLGSYLTKSTGVRVVFESAIVPKWGLAGGGSRILFKNVYISRGPETAELGGLPAKVSEDEEEETEEQAEERERMAKWTHFHMSIDTVEVSLSIGRWLDGKGLVKEATVTGVRGVVDRSHIRYDPKAPLDRFAYRHEAHPGDFELENLQVEDFLVTVYQPDHFRPYTFSIFNADIRRLRKQWLFYDLLSADSITGQVDNCLFSLHKPQSIGRTSEEDLKDVQWARMSRFRIDGVPIDHMQSAHDTGVLSWVTSGRCDLVADIRFPVSEHSLDLSAIVADIVDKVEKEINTLTQPSEKKVVEGNRGKRIPGQRILARGASLEVPKGWVGAEGEKEKARKVTAVTKNDENAETQEGVVIEKKKEEDPEEEEKVVSIDLDLRFKDLKASVPFFTSDLTYVNNALIRPIVAFINSNRTLIPIHCHMDLPLSEFDGSWTTYDVGLLEKMSEQTYAALAHHVQNSQNQRLQRVSLWTIQLTANAVLSAFKNNLDSY